MSPLNPYQLEPPISLNRVIVADLPGVAMEAEARGKTGYQLISTMALAGLIRAAVDTLGLDPSLDDDTLNRAFDACLISDAPRVRFAAASIARQMGHQLGYLLLTLRRGDPVNRAARPAWDETYWQHWAGIRQIILGGGLVSERLGPLVCDHAQALLHQTGCDDVRLRLSPYGSALPLIGMARRAPANCTAALVLDGGSTAIKRGLALFSPAGLRQIRLLPAIPTQWGDASRDPENPPERAAWLLERFVTLIDQTRASVLTTGDAPPHLPVLASLAAYMRDGQPLAAQHGAYMQWIHITDNARDLIADRLADRWGTRVPVILEHDGTAAATAYAGEPCPTAVITLGTALGIGFPPPGAHHARPLDSTFEIQAQLHS